MSRKTGENPYAYLSYATARDMWAVGQIWFLVWLALTAFGFILGARLGFGFLGTIEGVKAIDPTLISAVPPLAWFVAIAAILLWFLRGVHFTFPNLTFKSWLSFTAFLTLNCVFHDKRSLLGNTSSLGGPHCRWVLCRRVSQ